MARIRGREDRALCFRDLRDIAMAIGILFIILSIAGFIMSIVVMTALLPATVKFMDQYNEERDTGYDSEELVMATAAGVLVLSVVGLLLSALLFHAAKHKRKRLVVPWLVFYGLLFTLLGVLAIISFIMACISGRWPSIVAGIIEIFAAFVLWTWWAAVWAHYYTM